MSSFRRMLAVDQKNDTNSQEESKRLTNREQARGEVGQCVDCLHARRIKSANGSEFYRCQKAKYDERLTDYPPLPVRSCPAFARDPAVVD
jgi:hypothetical protein